jgi:hypothetical protein
LQEINLQEIELNLSRKVSEIESLATSKQNLNEFLTSSSSNVKEPSKSEPASLLKESGVPETHFAIDDDDDEEEAKIESESLIDEDAKVQEEKVAMIDEV